MACRKAVREAEMGRKGCWCLLARLMDFDDNQNKTGDIMTKI